MPRLRRQGDGGAPFLRLLAGRPIWYAKRIAVSTVVPDGGWGDRE